MPSTKTVDLGIVTQPLYPYMNGQTTTDIMARSLLTTFRGEGSTGIWS